MEMQMTEEMSVADAVAVSLLERLQSAAGMIEAAAERLGQVELAAEARELDRHSELERRLAEAEATIATLKASGRKTSAVGSLVAKEGGGLDVGAMDTALASLSVEQRIAVKAGLMRAGLLG